MSYLETRIVKSSREPIKIVQNRPHDGHWGIHWREKEERETNTAGSRRTKRIRRGWRIERKEKGREKDESGGGRRKRKKGNDWSRARLQLQERPEANWCVPVVWRARQNLVAEGKPREVDGWVLQPLSTGLLGHSYASAVRPISSRNGLSYIRTVTSIRSIEIPGYWTFQPRPTKLDENYHASSRLEVSANFLQRIIIPGKTVVLWPALLHNLKLRPE